MLSNATVVVHRVTTTTDDLGNGTTSETSETLEWALVYPRSSQESVDPSRPGVISGAYLLAPLGTFLSADDYITVSDCDPNSDGTWQVEGDAGAYPLDNFGGVVAALKRAS